MTATCLALVAQGLPVAVYTVSAAVIEPGFQIATVEGGLDTPTAIAFAPDGRFFVAQRGGVVLEYDSPTDSTATQVIDLSTQVHSVGDRGLLALAVDPQFPTRPYIYVAYMVDAQPGATSM